MMDRTQLEQLMEISRKADAYAVRVCPPPKQDPIQTGFIGMIIVAVAIMVFKLFAGRDPDAFDLPHAWAAIVGFIVPWGYLKLQERKHSRVRHDEYERLLAQHKQARQEI